MEKTTTFREHFRTEVAIQFENLFGGRRYWLHIIALLINVFFIVSSYTAGIELGKGKTYGILLVILTMITVLLEVYSFLFLIIPFGRVKRKAAVVWIGFLLNFIFWFAIQWGLVYVVTHFIAGKNYTFSYLGGYSFGRAFRLMWVFFAIYYFFDLYYQQRQFRKYKQGLKERLDAENRFLKSQINPHFLFNTLNNIYSKALHNVSEAGGLIDKLKNLLHYMLYECERDFVPLKGELAFIQSYIALEEIRNKSGRLKVQALIEGEVKEQLIAPLLIVNFIENAFKHGVKAHTEEAVIMLKLQVTGTRLHMELSNTVPPETDKGLAVQSEGGIGVENVRKRLALLYPGAHKLSITNDHALYTVSLTLNLFSA